jgi:hypothetical protein
MVGAISRTFSAGIHRRVHADDALGDVAQRQEADALVFLSLREQRQRGAGGVDQRAVTVHGALGLAGGARGVDQDGQVVGTPGRPQALEQAGMRAIVHRAGGAQVLQARHHRVGEVGEALHVEHDDPGQQRQVRAHLERLVELLVVLDEEHARLRVGTQVCHLLGRVGGVDAVGHAAGALHREVDEHPFDDRAGEDGGALPRLESERREPHGDLAHRGAGLVPGPAAPDAEHLLAQPDALAPLRHRVPEHLRHRVARHDDPLVRRRRLEIPEVAHDGSFTSTSSSSSSGARRARRLP